MVQIYKKETTIPNISWFILQLSLKFLHFRAIFRIFAPNLQTMEKNILSQNVRRICKERKIQLKELAMKMGVDPSALTRSLGGNTRLDTMQKMASALNVSLKSLLEKQDDVEGFIRIRGKVYQFNSRQELNKLLDGFDV